MLPSFWGMLSLKLQSYVITVRHQRQMQSNSDKRLIKCSQSAICTCCLCCKLCALQHSLYRKPLDFICELTALLVPLLQTQCWFFPYPHHKLSLKSLMVRFLQCAVMTVYKSENVWPTMEIYGLKDAEVQKDGSTWRCWQEEKIGAKRWGSVSWQRRKVICGGVVTLGAAH